MRKLQEEMSRLFFIGSYQVMKLQDKRSDFLFYRFKLSEETTGQDVKTFFKGSNQEKKLQDKMKDFLFYRLISSDENTGREMRLFIL